MKHYRSMRNIFLSRRGIVKAQCLCTKIDYRVTAFPLDIYFAEILMRKQFLFPTVQPEVTSQVCCQPQWSIWLFLMHALKIWTRSIFREQQWTKFQPILNNCDWVRKCFLGSNLINFPLISICYLKDRHCLYPRKLFWTVLRLSCSLIKQEISSRPGWDVLIWITLRPATDFLERLLKIPVLSLRGTWECQYARNSLRPDWRRTTRNFILQKNS